MKFNLLLLLFVATASTVLGQAKKFTISGKVDSSFKSDKIYFTRVKMFAEEEPKPVAVTVKDGKFNISGSITEPEQALVSLTDDLRQRENFYSFLLDEGSIQLNLTGKIKETKVQGSKANDGLQKYYEQTKAMNEDFGRFYQGLQQSLAAGKNQDSLKMIFQERYTTYSKAQEEAKLSFIKKNPEAFVSLILLKEIGESSENYNKADSLFNTLAGSLKSSPSGKTMATRFSNLKRLSVGSIAPDFTQADTTGKPVSLKSFQGKYVLLDFWASWCGPCRQENPNVVNAYHRFKNKNFTVLGISLDRPGAKNAWLKAISDDQLAWTQVSDLKFWQNEVAQMYQIKSIPQNFLLDPTGKIIAKNLRGDELQQFLADLFEEKNGG